MNVNRNKWGEEANLVGEGKGGKVVKLNKTPQGQKKDKLQEPKPLIIV